ncbi:tannase and feruloyl esterase-domain-containing protein [Fusarium solani]|uniref:Carboxylic ester hydrolase n=1 Tax=Fusarium solani TaxID=169388 RepID=A0A9P9GM22_FUSSL|nr:tannase and feruloyl esterase-domain-containing protein [Fusarium solani]KAH7240459.1 tannase and feruloyl esterase-domain-containing protein [Fusarium solani]
MIFKQVLLVLSSLCLACSGSPLDQMHRALGNLFKDHANTTIIQVRHFDPGEYMLPIDPGSGRQHIIPIATNGATVVKLFFPDPDTWTGRIFNFVDDAFQGSPFVTLPDMSGLPMYPTIQYSEWASKMGYVAAISNGGHFSRYPFPSWYLPSVNTSYLLTADDQYNDEGWKNFAYQGTHIMAEVSKQISKEYYGKSHNSAYLAGCSIGGRQVYQIAQDIPEDYDGYLVSAPSFNGSYFYGSIAYDNIVVNNDLVPINETISETQLEIVSQKAAAHHDIVITGQHDGYITEWQHNDYDATKDPSVLRLEDGGDCNETWALSLTQAKALNKIWYGVTVDGSVPDVAEDNGMNLVRPANQLYWGKARGSQLQFVNTLCQVPGLTWPVIFLNRTLGDPSYFEGGQNVWKDFSYKQFAEYVQKAAKEVYHGTADYSSPVGHVALYYEQSAEFTGGMNKTADFHRVFFVPGMTHCSLTSNQAGQAAIPFPSAQELVGKLVTWVETGVAPDHIMAATPDERRAAPFALTQSSPSTMVLGM